MTTTPKQVTPQEFKFSDLYEIELEIKRSRATEGFGIDPATRERAKADTRRRKAELFTALDHLTPAEAAAYGEYRKAQQQA